MPKRKRTTHKRRSSTAPRPMPSINFGVSQEVVAMAQEVGALAWERMQAEARKSQFPN